MEKPENMDIMDTMKIKVLIIISGLILLCGCSEFALLMSGSSIAISQNSYAKMYNAADMLTIMGTKKDIKTHAYKKVKVMITTGKDLYDISQRSRGMGSDDSSNAR